MQYLPQVPTSRATESITLTGSIRGTLKAIDPDLAVSVENGLILSAQLEPGLSNLHLRARIATAKPTSNSWRRIGGLRRSTPPDAYRSRFFRRSRLTSHARMDPPRSRSRCVDWNPSAIPGAPDGLGGRVSLDVQGSGEPCES